MYSKFYDENGLAIAKKIAPDIFSAEEFLGIDEIVCVESVTEEEIVNLVLNKEKEDVHIDINDNNNIEPLVITHDEVKKSLQTIISFVNNRKHNENELSTINIFNNYMQRLLSNDLVQGTLNFEQKWLKIDFFYK